jgi:hypothetical protein
VPAGIAAQASTTTLSAARAQAVATRVVRSVGARPSRGASASSSACWLVRDASIRTPRPDSSYSLLWPPFAAVGLGVGLTVSAASNAIVGNAPAADSGVAGGLQSTATQLGGVLGTAILGSVLVDRLVDAGVPAGQARGLAQAKEAVGQGLVPPVPGAGASLREAVEADSHAAFMSGLHVAMVIGAVLSGVALVLALLIRPGENAASAAVHV